MGSGKYAQLLMLYALMGESEAKIYDGPYRSTRPVNITTVKCSVCGTEFEITPPSIRKVCSRKCEEALEIKQKEKTRILQRKLAGRNKSRKKRKKSK